MLLFLFFILFNSSAIAADKSSSAPSIVETPTNAVVLPKADQALNSSQCEAVAVTQDLQAKYEVLKKNIESDFSTGLPSQLKIRLTALRTEADFITQKIYDLQNSNQEINNIVNDTVNKLDEFIQILPEITANAPRIRDQYIVPFANLNSLKVDELKCLAEMQAKASAEAAEQEGSSVNIYQTLTQELQLMSNNLHQAQTISPQKYIIYRSELMETLSKYNKMNRLEDAQALLTTIPSAINAIQIEIESLLPGFQLSKNYYSVTTL